MTTVKPRTAKKLAPHFDSLEQEAFLGLWRTFDRLRAEDELFGRHDLTSQQYNALRLLRSEQPRQIRTLDLARRLVSRAPDITRLLDKLEQRGLIERDRPADNRRVVFVGITTAGIELLAELQPPLRECHTRQLGHLSRKELKELIALMRAARQPHEDADGAWRWRTGQDFDSEEPNMITEAQRATDVVVIGGGPAGSTAATLIAQHGYKVTLFERDRFPRFHIGESLIPETYWVLERLKMLDKMRASHFVKKHSVQFVSASGKLSAPFYFWDNKPHECSQTWQVVRSEFDLMMLRNAEEQGVEVHEETRVLDVLFENNRAVGVRVQGADGPYEVRAKAVVDASGQSAMLQNRFKLRLWDPLLNKGAIWTYWEGAYRDTGRDEGATIVLQTANKQGWFWYIPLHNNVVSVGVVAPFDYLFKGRGSHEQTYQEEIERSPAVHERVTNARRTTGYFATRDYSYRATQVAGDGWVLVGDAFGFLDPLYSSGVLLALKSGELAADAIAEGLARGDVTAAQLGKWGPKFNQGVDRMRRLVCEYYDGFSFGRFVRAFPQFKGTITDLLIGDLFTDRVDAAWQPMESLYDADKKPPTSWTDGTSAEMAGSKANELILPEGPKP